MLVAASRSRILFDRARPPALQEIEEGARRRVAGAVLQQHRVLRDRRIEVSGTIQRDPLVAARDLGQRDEAEFGVAGRTNW